MTAFQLAYRDLEVYLAALSPASESSALLRQTDKAIVWWKIRCEIGGISEFSYRALGLEAIDMYFAEALARVRNFA